MEAAEQAAWIRPDWVCQSFNSGLPVVGTAVQVHHCEYGNVTLLHAIKDTIREMPCKATANTRLQLWPSIGEVNDVLNGGVYLTGKIVSKAILADFVVLDGLLKLDLALGVEGVVHPAKRFRICAKTWSPGIAFTRPACTSSRRRSASAIH